MSERAILSVKWSPASAVGRIKGFVRYVSFRDHHQGVDEDRPLQGLLRYVSHRDPTARTGRVFNADGPAGAQARAALLRFVQRSCARATLTPTRAPERAVYRIVISPEFADGLDLKRLTRATIAQLERDAGGLGPWIAAEHRNTKHPHVHVILAAKREIAPGRFRSVVISRQRLARMKLTLGHDIELQRGGRPRDLEWEPPARGKTASRRRGRARSHRDSRHVAGLSFHLGTRVRRALLQLAHHYELEAERERRQRERERGWER